MGLTTKKTENRDGRQEMALQEREATRLVAVLSDYEYVSATLAQSAPDDGFTLMVRDHRFELDYEIGSHYDYWNFIGALVDHKQYIALPVQPVAA
jgi:hypothetical protein